MSETTFVTEETATVIIGDLTTTTVTQTVPGMDSKTFKPTVEVLKTTTSFQTGSTAPTEKTVETTVKTETGYTTEFINFTDGSTTTGSGIEWNEFSIPIQIF